MKHKDYKKALEYIKKHISDYTETEIKFLIENYDLGKNTTLVPSILRQIYDEVGLLEKDNIYEGFIKILEENFNIDSNILEVGGGVIPTLARKISLKLDKGKITIYDPRLIKKDSSKNKKYELKKDKRVLKPEIFNNLTDISDTDLLIGFMPCEASQEIIEQACQNNIDFLIALCEGGSHSAIGYLYEGGWAGKMVSLAKSRIKQSDLGSLCCSDLNKYNSLYPVIYNKRKTKNI